MATESDTEDSVNGLDVQEPAVDIKTSQLPESSHSDTRRYSLPNVRSSRNAEVQNLSSISEAGSAKSEGNDLQGRISQFHVRDDQTPDATASHLFKFNIDLQSPDNSDVKCRDTLRSIIERPVEKISVQSTLKAKIKSNYG